MKNIIILFLCLLPALAWGQFPANPSKVVQGRQTTAAGLVAVTNTSPPGWTPANWRHDAFMALDTVTARLWCWDGGEADWGECGGSGGGAGVDTMYLSGDSLFVESGADTFFVVLPSGIPPTLVIASPITVTLSPCETSQSVRWYVVVTGPNTADIIDNTTFVFGAGPAPVPEFFEASGNMVYFEFSQTVGSGLDGTIFTAEYDGVAGSVIARVISQAGECISTAQVATIARDSVPTLYSADGTIDDGDGREVTVETVLRFTTGVSSNITVSGEDESVNFQSGNNAILMQSGIGTAIRLEGAFGTVGQVITATGAATAVWEDLPAPGLDAAQVLTVVRDSVPTLYSTNATIFGERIVTIDQALGLQNAEATIGLQIDATTGVRMFGPGASVSTDDSLRVEANGSYGLPGQVLVGTSGFGSVWDYPAVTSDGVTVFGDGTPGDPLRTDPSAQILTVSGPTYQLTSDDASIYRSIIFTYDTAGGNVTVTVPDTLATNFYSLTIVKTGPGVLTVNGATPPRQRAAQLGQNAAATLASADGAAWHISGELLEKVCTLTDVAGTVTWNAALCASATLTLAGDYTLAVTNARAREFLTVAITQDGTGGRTLAWPSGTRYQGGTPLAVSTAANAEDVAIFYTRASGYNLEIGKGYAE